MMPRLLFSLLIVFVSAVAYAEVPKVAVLTDPAAAKSPVISLLEQELASRKDLSLVERANLGLIVDEQTLAKLGGNDRQARVALLRQVQIADAIVVVRTREKSLELGVCDTRRGLRLMHLTLDPAKGPAERSATLADEIARRLPVLMKRDAQVWAVPPLISRNLTAEHDHLKNSLAGVIEETLTARGDILCVELAEAKAFGEEIALGGPEMSRNLPYYVLGEFRHESRKPDSPANLTLDLTQGAKSLHKVTAASTPADQLATVATRHVAAMVEKTGGQPRQSDPAAEAQLLARRAAAFSTISNYQEPVDLIETAILLQPKNVQLRRDAITYYRRLIHSTFLPVDRHRNYAKKPEQWHTTVIAAARLYIRSIDHVALAYAASLDGPNHQRDVDLITGYDAGDIISRARDANVEPPPAVLEAIAELLAAERERLSPLFGRDASRSKWVEPLNHRPYFWYANLLEPERRVENLLGVFRHVADEEKNSFPLTYFFVSAMQLNWVSDGVAVERINADHQAARQQLERLRSLPQKNAPKWIATIEKRLADLQAEQLAAQTPKIKSTTKPVTTKPATTRPAIAQAKVTLQPIEIPWPAAIQGSINKQNPIQQWIPIGPDTAVVGSFSDLAVVKGLNDVRAIELPRGTHTHSMKFDGKYLWILGNAQPLLVDPATGKVQTVSYKDLLPPADQGLNVVPVAPRQAVVFGAFGRNDDGPSRSWIAMLSVADDMKVTAEVVHESLDREPPDVYMPATRQPLPNEVFHVNYGVTRITSAEGNVTHVILGRDHVFEVQKRKLFTLKPVFNYMGGVTMNDGAVWNLKTPGSSIDTKPLQLVRRYPNDFKIEVIEKAIPFHAQGQPPIELFAIGERFVLRKERRFWVYDRPARAFAELPIPSELLNKIEPADWTGTQLKWVEHAGKVIAYNPKTWKFVSATIEMPENPPGN